jgi:hypothetical protein
MLPHSCGLVLIKKNYIRARVGDVCISWSNLLVSLGK